MDSVNGVGCEWGVTGVCTRCGRGVDGVCTGFAQGVHRVPVGRKRRALVRGLPWKSRQPLRLPGRLSCRECAAGCVGEPQASRQLLAGGARGTAGTEVGANSNQVERVW